MASKWTRVSKRTLFIWCLLGGFICLFAPPSMTNRLQLSYAYVFGWPLQAGRHLTRASAVPVLNTVDRTADDQLQAEHQRLMNHIANLQAQLKDAHAQIDKLARLRMQPQWDRMSFVIADITMANVSQGMLVINRGQQDGVAVGQYVLGDLSVIGIVSGVWRQTAQVKLIMNAASRVPVTVGEAGLARVMEAAEVPLVPTTHAIRKGDAVYARKMPGLLDVPVIVGTIAQCRPDPKDPSVWDITVQPACDIAALASVAVIAAAPQQ